MPAAKKESPVKVQPPGKTARWILITVRLLVLAGISCLWLYLVRKETALPEDGNTMPLGVTPLSSGKTVLESTDMAATGSDEKTAHVASDSPDATSAEDGEVEAESDPLEMEWDALAWAITDAVVNQAHPDALAMATAAQQITHGAEIQSRLNDMETLLKDLSNVDELVMAGLTRVIGQEILLLHNGKSRRMIIRAVSASALSAVEVRPTGSVDEKNPVTIKASALAPKDKLKWLGDANTPARAVIKCLLHQQAGNVEQAREYAEKSGPLSEYMVTWLETAPVPEETLP